MDAVVESRGDRVAGGSGGGLGGLGFRLNPPNAGAERQLAVANEGLARCPGNERLRHARALSLKSLGDTDGARRELEALARDFPANAHAAHSLGLLLQELGEFDAAVKAFESGKVASLPCLTAAAAAASHSGDVARARGLFMEGSAVASSGGGRGRTGGFGPGGGSNDGGSSSTSFDSFDSQRSEARSTARSWTPPRWTAPAPRTPPRVPPPRPAVEGSRRRRRSTSSSSFGERMRTATRRDCAAHLRLWALLEKRDGAETVARTLFQRAADVDPTDGATWLQWGQFERRVSGAAAARARFDAGLAKCDPAILARRTCTKRGRRWRRRRATTPRRRTCSRTGRRRTRARRPCARGVRGFEGGRVRSSGSRLSAAVRGAGAAGVGERGQGGGGGEARGGGRRRCGRAGGGRREGSRRSTMRELAPRIIKRTY